MTDETVRETIRTALHEEWWRSIREKIEDAPDGHVERLTSAIMQRLDAVGLAKATMVEVTMDQTTQDGVMSLIRAQVQAQKTKPTIEAAAEAVRATRQRLANLLTERCPGPHRFVQHRDHRPPWCRACRYTAGGQPVPPREPDGGTPA